MLPCVEVDTFETSLSGGTCTGWTISASVKAGGGGRGKSVSSGLPRLACDTGGGGGGQDDSGDATFCRDMTVGTPAVCLVGSRGEMCAGEMEGFFVFCVMVLCSSAMAGSLSVSLSTVLANTLFNIALTCTFPCSFTSMFFCTSLSQSFVLFATFKDLS